MIQAETIAMQHSENLKQRLVQLIKQQGGKISFTEYMQQALYAPGLGYYSAGATKLGNKGDFITAPELGALFAKCLAVQCVQILNNLSAKNIIEFGAGSGKLACDLLQQLTAQEIELENYYIVEVSADLRQRQQDLIFTTQPNFKNKVQWLEQLPKQPIDAIIIANEVLDAMPVTRFHFENDILQEYYVTLQDHNFVFERANATPTLSKFFNEYKIANYISQPYCSEINTWLPNWIKELSAMLSAGVVLLCDYGFPRAEYYHPQRNTGTLMCHFQHRCHANPLINLGLQDITAHVDFTAIAEAAVEHDLDIAGYTNQASFLLNCGITSMLKQHSWQLNHELQTLTSPAEMGELFKVIALTKNYYEQLIGFEAFDKLHTL